MSKTVTIPTDGMNPFVVMHNGIKYTYTPGETVTVPDGVALEIEEYKRWREKYYGTTHLPFEVPSGGSGGGVSSYNNLTDKPQREFLFEEHELVLNTSVTAGDYYKFSDTPIKYRVDHTFKLVCAIGDDTEEPEFVEATTLYYEATSGNVTYHHPVHKLVFNGFFGEFIVYSTEHSNVTVDDITFPEAGIYANYQYGNMVTGYEDIVPAKLSSYYTEEFDSNSFAELATYNEVDAAIEKALTDNDTSTDLPFVILTASYNNNNYTLTVDFTWSELEQAQSSGKTVFLQVSHEFVTLLPMIMFTEMSRYGGSADFAGLQTPTSVNGVSTAAYWRVSLTADYGSDEVSGSLSKRYVRTETLDEISPKKLYLKSSTENSEKEFVITVDDTGTITATEVTE